MPVARPRRYKPLKRENEPVIHSGVLFKRGYGRLLGRKTWKPRHFVLTRTKLRYFTFENGKLRDEIDLRRCSEKSFEVMPADIRKRGRSPASIWRLALNVPQGHRLIMAAPTEFEMNAWIRHIRGVLRELAKQRHPRDEEPGTTPSPKEQDAVEETKEEEETFEPRKSSQFDDAVPLKRSSTATWKAATSDFQNFVAQPRRSVIFRRHSFEELPIVPGVYRYSNGEIDNGELQKELDELRADLVRNEEEKENDKDDDDMDEEEEEALLNALEEFSRARHESNREGAETKVESLSLESLDESSRGDGDGAAPFDLEKINDVNKHVPFGPTKPIFHYKKEDAPMEICIDSTGLHHDAQADQARWFARVSGKFQRQSWREKTKKSRESSVYSKRAATAPADHTMYEDDHDDLPAHFCGDPATSKQRRYSTGSMLLTSERPAPASEYDSETEREEALIQELLTGFVDSKTDEGSGSLRDLTSPRNDLNACDVEKERSNRERDVSQASSFDVDAMRALHFNTTAASSALWTTRPSFDVDDSEPQEVRTAPVTQTLIPAMPVEPVPNELGKAPDQSWFANFKAKWRANRDEKKHRKRAAKRTKSGLTGNSAVPSLASEAATAIMQTVASDTHSNPAEDAGRADCEVASVLSDLVANVAALDYSDWTPRPTEADVTSPCSYTARAMQSRPLDRSPSQTDESVQTSKTKKRSIFRRWRDKLSDKRETKSRRHSTGDMIPVSIIPAEDPSCETEDPESRTEGYEQSEEHHFSARYRRAISKPGDLIELQQVGVLQDAQAQGSSNIEGDAESEEEVVVVVVRRRHSIGSADNRVPVSSQKRVKYRVYIDVDSEVDTQSSIESSSLKRSMPSTLSSSDVHRMVAPTHQPTRICAA